jgi:hypothetical protein
MNTTIYRAKRRNNGEEVMGSLVNVRTSVGYRHFIVPITSTLTPYGCTTIYEYPDEFLEIIPSTLAQCTGRQDKNGNWIFGSIEIDGKMTKGGDVVKGTFLYTIDELTCPIIWSNESSCWLLGEGRCLQPYTDLEIIGRQYKENENE